VVMLLGCHIMVVVVVVVSAVPKAVQEVSGSASRADVGVMMSQVLNTISLWLSPSARHNYTAFIRLHQCNKTHGCACVEAGVVAVEAGWMLSQDQADPGPPAGAVGRHQNHLPGPHP
ncbi:hypothetical protein Hamer_G026166, partial [Homarus americanus]